MLFFIVLIISLLSLTGADLRTSTRRYKPIIQVTEEIDINDITFTTSAPEFDRSFSHKTANYYAGVKHDAATPLTVFPALSYKPGYADVIYASGQPLIKYKPYKVFKVQDGFRPIPYKPKSNEKSKLIAFDPIAAHGGPEPTKQYSTKVVPFPGQLQAKPPTRATNFLAQDNKNFVPSPTFSPTVLAQINSDNAHVGHVHSEPFASPKVLDRPKPGRKTQGRKIPENRKPSEEFPESPRDKVQGLGSAPSQESPQQSESFLSEISTLHKGGTAGNELEGVADLKTGERVEFQMYGMDGPQSYKFGFDTGKGHNRHFRFEERDNTGKVKGHYGYLDEDGKMRIMKYEADPITGFHAGPVEISPEDD